MRQIFVARMGVSRDVDPNYSFEVALYVIRRRIETALRWIIMSGLYQSL